ncbi:maoC family domain protein [Mycobacterium kansasii 732]|nr:maoC family domain protein [Mycobacterium kansasii 732]
MTCKAITDALLDGDASAVAAYGARFAGVAYPAKPSRSTYGRTTAAF